ncbi:PREDICTED: nodulin-related protein 1-like [Ipomoea nil]|uniref:nodulin-related protein 1-like n=1 Tax=Ipomoea nil TaxID=35883 RepID=UPI000900B89C|nr:PREDICTED: nodulin-related protein 1-like [Ipomoea nil]
MDFLKNALDGGHESDQKPSDHSGHSNADLFSSAKVVAEAAQAQLQNKNSEIDKREVAGAAANLLDAAQKYGKLDETTGVGQYVEKAEGYLRGYGQPAAAAAGEAVEENAKQGEDSLKKEPSGESHGGAGDFMKAAGDFLKRD